MLVCPQCRTSYSSSATGTCIRDGATLVGHAAYVVSETDPLRGLTIRGDYTIGPRIGQGGMGTVYRARQASLRRDVAVKILKPEHAADADTVARFQREAAAMSLLAHPNTVRVFDFGQTDDGLLYLVMELLEGELITQVLARRGALETIEAIRTCQQILRSLSEAHAQGVVHRDLKPDNIFVARVPGQQLPVIKVLDFGIAKLLTGDQRLDSFETQAGTVFGTPRFMSPEQAQGASLDNRSDLYSVGAMLYQMLTGRAPFIDDDAVVIMAKHIRETPPLPSVVARDRQIPLLLEGVVMRALAKEPKNRFQVAAEFDAALEACVGEGTGNRTALDSRATPLRRRSVGRVLFMVGLTAAVAGLIGYAAYREFVLMERRAVFSGVARAATVKPRAEPLPTAVSLKPEITEAPALALGAQRPDDQRYDDEDGPGPAVVSLRSEPNGATVYRDGQPLGDTPLNLLVPSDEHFVRIELRAEGFEPLLAELTARDGERVLVLSAEDEPDPPPRARGGRRHEARRRAPEIEREVVPALVEPPAAPSAETPPAVKPVEPAARSPYERFE